MDRATLFIIISIIGTVFWGAILALLARRKNLNLWLWGGLAAFAWMFLGLIGFLLILVELIVLAFTPYKCSKCKAPLNGDDEIFKKLCPACDQAPAIEADGAAAGDRP